MRKQPRPRVPSRTPARNPFSIKYHPLCPPNGMTHTCRTWAKITARCLVGTIPHGRGQSLKSLPSSILRGRRGRVGVANGRRTLRDIDFRTISTALWDPPVTRNARASESLAGCPALTWICKMADLSTRPRAAVSAGSAGAAGAGT
eukprot:9476571-Pyramimonas_sp.AAC.1